MDTEADEIKARLWYIKQSIPAFVNLSFLTLFNKACLTFGTADFDLSFSFRYTDFLTAGGTFVDMMCLSLCQKIFLCRKPGAEPARFGKVCLVFSRTFVNIT